MEKIKDYLLPENEAGIYENEARSSLALAEEVAKKVNELIDEYWFIDKSILSCNISGYVAIKN